WSPGSRPPGEGAVRSSHRPPAGFPGCLGPALPSRPWEQASTKCSKKQTYVRRRLGAAKEGDDVARSAAPAAARSHHERLLGLEQDFRGPVERAVDAELFRVTAIQLAQQVDNAPPDMGRNQLQLLDPAFLDGTQQLIRFAQLA